MEGTPSITAGISNIQHPETGWQNVSVQRFGLKGKRILSMYVVPGNQSFAIWTAYRMKNLSCPVTISIGVDPVVYLCSQAKAPVGVCEYDLWGAFTGQPLELVKAETSKLLVPTTAEIVIEGEVHPTQREMDGPFPEFCGYYTTISEVARVEVKAITMRKDPIYYYLNMGMPPNEGNEIGGLMESMSIFRRLSATFPGILDIYHPHWLLTILKVDKRISKAWSGFAFYLASLIKSECQWAKKVVWVVDDDVEDVSDLYEVCQSLIGKFQASKDVRIIPRTLGHTLDASEPWAGQWGWMDFMVLDCTEPPPPYDEGYKRGLAVPPKEVMEKVKDNWSEYGFKEI